MTISERVADLESRGFSPEYIASVVRSLYLDHRQRAKAKGLDRTTRTSRLAQMQEAEQQALELGLSRSDLMKRVDVNRAGPGLNTVVGVAAPATEVIVAELPGYGETRIAYSGPASVSWSYERKKRPTPTKPPQAAGDLMAQLEASLAARTQR